MSVQIASASADTYFNPTDFSTGWHKEDTTTTNMWQSILFRYTGGSKHIIVGSPAAGTGSIYVSQLSPLQTPPNRQNHTAIWAVGYDPGGAGTFLTTVYTFQVLANYVNEVSPGIVLASTSISGSSFTSNLFRSNISEASASLITDYTQLFLRVNATAAPESDTVDLLGFSLSIPASGSSHSNVSRTPSSLISGSVGTVGSVNGSPLVQLLNPTGSTVKLVVYNLSIIGGGSNGGSTTLCRRDINALRRTGDPLSLGLGGTMTTGSAVRVDPTDLTPIQGKLFGYTFSNEQFYEDGTGIPCLLHDESLVQWLGRPSAATLNLIPIRFVGQFPWTVMPGSAIELTWLFNGGFAVEISAEWDEIPL